MRFERVSCVSNVNFYGLNTLNLMGTQSKFINCAQSKKSILIRDDQTPRKPLSATSRLQRSRNINESGCNRIILILDESGSMNTQTQDIIGGVNEMIKQQRLVEPERNHEIFFDVVKFSSNVLPVRSDTLQNVNFFTTRDYCPSGSTALYDAVGKTISQYRNEKDVVMVIGTDGGENASRNYSKDEVVRMISEQREKFGWEFVYLSEDLNTFKQGNSIGIINGAEGCSNICVDKIGSTLQSYAYNEGISNCRQKKKANFSSISKM